MRNRPTVWVVKEQVMRGPTGPVPMDYTAAYEYGDVEFITETDFPTTRGPSALKLHWHERVKAVMHEMSNDDFIVLTGGPLSIFLIGFVLGVFGELTPTLLIWNREQSKYVPVSLKDFITTYE